MDRENEPEGWIRYASKSYRVPVHIGCLHGTTCLHSNGGWKRSETWEKSVLLLCEADRSYIILWVDWRVSG